MVRKVIIFGPLSPISRFSYLKLQKTPIKIDSIIIPLENKRKLISMEMSVHVSNLLCDFRNEYIKEKNTIEW